MTDTLRYRYPLQLPASLKDTAARLAKEDGVSLNQWIVATVAQKIGAVETAEIFLHERAAGAREGDPSRYLENAPDAPPGPGDELTGDPRPSRTTHSLVTPALSRGDKGSPINGNWSFASPGDAAGGRMPERRRAGIPDQRLARRSSHTA
ncbi:MAG: hypothetical protein OYH76_22995 [Defluviicoccus sp.]|nr:hypothetical protein [Defluviicoccus sp.]MDE0278773.1 hypothetical protein [Defluviicoccus sp.]